MSLWWKFTVFINLREKRVTNPAHPDSLPVVVFFQASSAHGVFLLPLSLVKIEYAGKENAAPVFSSRLTRVLTMHHNFAADNLTPLICIRVVIAVKRQDSEWKESIAWDVQNKIFLQVRWHQLWIGEFCCAMSVPGLSWTSDKWFYQLGQALLHSWIQEMKEIHRFSKEKKIPLLYSFYWKDNR